MNTSAAHASSASPPRKPAPGRVSKCLRIIPSPAPIERVIRAADALRDLTKIGRAGIRYISATEARVDGDRASLKRSSVGNRRWELAQSVRSLRAGRRAA